MTIEEKAKAYDKALESIKELYSKGSRVVVSKEEFETIFPELTDSEDERMRNIAINACKYMVDNFENSTKQYEDAITWLEKQGKNPKKVSVWKHWKDGIAGNAEGKQIYLIKIGNIYSISSCLGCECDYIELSELDKLMREEKQGKSKWTEEDDYNVQCCIAKAEKDIRNGYSGRNQELIEWLKSLKKRMCV